VSLAIDFPAIINILRDEFSLQEAGIVRYKMEQVEDVPEKLLFLRSVVE
jgi:hypothetical protein